MPAFEKGNTLGTKAKLFDQALRRAIQQEDGARLRKAAEALLDLAASGEAWAVKELADRLDGRSTQVAEVSLRDVRPDELSDSELLRLAAAGSNRTAETAGSEEKPSQLH